MHSAAPYSCIQPERYRGEPGGDDYQRYWINPTNPNVMLVVADQGPIVTVHGGETWSSWYNQPTAQFYHVTANNSWPYYALRRPPGIRFGVCRELGNDGSIGFGEWRPVGASEYSYFAPDPLNPDILYGGTVSRFNRHTGQTQNVSPNAGAGRGGAGSGRPNLFRGVRTMPILFSPINPRKLFYSTNVLWETVDGGQHWKQKSPDLTRASWEVPKSVGTYIGTPARGGRGGGAPAAGGENFSSIAGSVLGPLNVLQDADEQPVSAVVMGATERINAFKAFESRWNTLLGARSGSAECQAEGRRRQREDEQLDNY